ncbi:hypothetical protein ACWIGI_28705 [Nocardia sp. NPDC055321]
MPGKVDGGRISALNLEVTRSARGDEGGKAWDQYAMAIFGTPQHKPWSEFYARVKAAQEEAPKSWPQVYDEALQRACEAFRLTKAEVDALESTSPLYRAFANRQTGEIDRAREAYWAGLDYCMDRARRDYSVQPRIAALRAFDEYKHRFGGPEDRFDHLTRDEYVQQCRDEALPGYAFLTEAGYWMSKGEMGWFGMDDANADSTQAYLAAANKHIDSLTEDMWLVSVDCHI